MATYTELRSLFGDGDLQVKLQVAVVVASQIILSGADTVAPWDQTAGAHELRAKWSNAALSSTVGEAERMLKFVLAANRALTIEQIRGASDSGIQDAVNGCVDAVAQATFGV